MKRVFIFTLTVLIMLSILLLSGCNIDGNQDGTTHTHEFGEWKVAKEATCTEDGSKVRTCECGESEEEVIAAIGHTEETLEATSPTCTESGLTEGKRCTLCGETTVKQESISALDHDFTYHTEGGADGTPLTVAVCQRDGCLKSTKSASGLYDSENNLLVSWCDFVNVYELKIDNGAISNLSKFYENCKKTEILIKGTTLIFDDSITNINLANFIPFKNLTNILIPSSVTIINTSTWECCVNIKNIIVDENNEHYKSIDGNLYDKEGKTLIKYAGGKEDTEFTIPSGVTEIGICAFTYSNHLEKIIIPDSVTKIEGGVFYHCDLLRDVYFEGTEEQWIALDPARATLPDSIYFHYAGKTEIITIFFLNYSGMSGTPRYAIVIENENIYIRIKSHIGLCHKIYFTESFEFANADYILSSLENRGDIDKKIIMEKLFACDKWYVLEMTLSDSTTKRMLICRVDDFYYLVNIWESNETVNLSHIDRIKIK